MYGDRRKFKRDLRIDFLRGIALLTIFIDHVPENRWASVTQQAFGFSDAAELFVALAGFSAVLAYGRYFTGEQALSGARRIASRIGIIYVSHLGTLVVVGVILVVTAAMLNSAEQIEAMKFQHLIAGDPTAIVNALLLRHQPRYFDILPLYVVLLTAFPLLYLLLKRSLMLGLGASASLWLIVQFTSMNLLTADGEGWHFNPLAWQFLMALGMAAALRLQKKPLPNPPWLVGSAIAVLVVSLLLRAPWTNWPLQVGSAPLDLKPYGAWMVKTDLGPIRLIHIIAFGYLALVLLHPRASWLKRPPARLISDAGANSLEVFCLGVILSVAGGALIHALGSGAVLESWISTVGVAVLLIAGLKLASSTRDRKRARDRVSKMQADAITRPA
jgi:hypothetical protein